ncbi:MAG: glutamate racemase [candidate division Zixibacteria bacterium CG_4_9_14_3_um_filter_46_8]|nr:MAG: glutamate racemase [candidate division Zixibacteria bacterium CG_4_9_14_3_um_filter_46_8]
MKDTSKRPIGIFDSGIGGLTVVAEMMKRLPNEDIVYFGDIGRFPYGVRSPEVIKKFSRQNVRFLLMQKVKYVVVACNTASAQALNAIRRNFDIPMMGVIEPGAYGAVSTTKNRKVGVIGTAGTIASSSYTKAIQKLDGKIKVVAAATPLFVALAEEGYLDRPASHLIVQDYLLPIKKRGIDTLVLGCTHYPLLRNVIAKVMGHRVFLVDSAEWTVKAVKEDLQTRTLLNHSRIPGKYRYFVSDTPEKFIQVGNRFLGRDVAPAKRIDIEKY